MTLEEYAVEKLKNLEVDNLFLRNQLENTIVDLNEMREAYKELKGFVKKYAEKCKSNEGYKFDKYFWEHDPEYDFIANLIKEDDNA